jgi:hypothetical protein
MLRGCDRVFTETLTHDRDPDAWTDEDVDAIVRKMLRAIERFQSPDGAGVGPISLRGLSWIVSTFRNGVVIAFEIHTASAVAGPFPIQKDALDAMMQRVTRAGQAPETVH